MKNQTYNFPFKAYFAREGYGALWDDKVGPSIHEVLVVGEADRYNFTIDRPQSKRVWGDPVSTVGGKHVRKDETFLDPGEAALHLVHVCERQQKAFAKEVAEKNAELDETIDELYAFQAAQN